jgi:hypothetical protein
LEPPGWNSVAVGDPTYDSDGNLIECDAPTGFVHIKTHTRFVLDTFGLSNTAGTGVYVDVEAGYRRADISVEYDY